MRRPFDGQGVGLRAKAPHRDAILALSDHVPGERKAALWDKFRD